MNFHRSVSTKHVLPRFSTETSTLLWFLGTIFAEAQTRNELYLYGAERQGSHQKRKALLLEKDFHLLTMACSVKTC
jgi:hypothetical protein